MKKIYQNIIIYVIIFAVVLVAATAYRGMNDSQAVQVREVPLSQFVQYLQNEAISEINVTDTRLTGKLSETETVYAYANSVVELSIISEQYIFPQIEAGTLTYETDEPNNTGSSHIEHIAFPFCGGSDHIPHILYDVSERKRQSFPVRQIQSKMVKGNEKKVTFADGRP